ncbi:MAG: response regulator [Defluviitaleaceae bacterium]|nr:response regulator [Defluviitaleaceae bacterium]MCL2274289.1 response regulator [Defluviitaleaceae bacterium]
MSRKKIIYLDDVKHSILSIKTRMKEVYDIYPAQTVAAMFERLENIAPDLILLDINMPEKSGLEVLAILKDHPLYAHIPVVFLTAHFDRNVLAQGIKRGAVDFLLKSYSDDVFIECIDSIANPTNPPERPIVLAIDDNPSILKSINFFLSKKYEVRILNKPEQTMGLLGMITPDLFLLDYNMPVINGFDLVKEIKKHPQHSDTPIVFLTAEGSVDNLTVAMHLGVNDFIVKPIEENILHEKMAAALSGYRLIRRLRAHNGK